MMMMKMINDNGDDDDDDDDDDDSNYKDLGKHLLFILPLPDLTAAALGTAFLHHHHHHHHHHPLASQNLPSSFN